MSEKIVRVAISGTREGCNELQHECLERLFFDLSSNHDKVILHHGDCIGVDSEAHKLAREHKFVITIHPPTKSKYRAFCGGFHTQHQSKSYNERNIDIVDSADILIAIPLQTEKERGGTWHAINYAKKIKKPLIIMHQDGGMSWEMSTYDEMRFFDII